MSKAFRFSLLVSDLLIEKRISLLFLTETWIQNVNEEIFLKHASPVGYSYHHKSRPTGSRGGGVGVIYHDSIKLMDMTSQFKEFQSFESLVLSATINGESVWFFIIYRPPPSKTNNIQSSQFVPEFTEFMETALLKTGHVCFLGDFNILWDTINQSERRDFASLLSSMNLHQHIDAPTHSKGHTLYYVITRSDSSIFAVDDVNLLLSDHYLILGSLNFKRPKYPATEVKYRKLKDINIEVFQNEIANSCTRIDEHEDIESAVKQYNSVLRDLLDKFAPVKTATVISRPKNAWYTPDISSKKREKRKIERKLKSLRKALHKRSLTLASAPNLLHAKIRDTQNRYVVIRNDFVLALNQA